MEMSTVFPPLASPTEGDDLCETDVSNVPMDSVTLLICLCGLFGNGAVLCLLRWKLTIREIFILALIDFLFLLYMAPSALLFLLEDLSCSLIMSPLYLRILFHATRYSYCFGLFGLTYASFLTAIGKLCDLLCHCHFRRCLLWVVLIVFWFFFVLITLFPKATFLCPSHEQQQCRAVLISMFIVMLLLCVAPVVIPCTIEFIKTKSSSQQQQLKRRDIAVCLAVLFTVILLLWNFLEHLGYIPVSSQVVFLLTCIHNSIKPFIYFLVGRCWRPCSVGSLRESLQRVFVEPEENTPRRNDDNMDRVL